MHENISDENAPVYTAEQLKNVLLLVETMKKIKQEIIAEGIPVEEYERLFITEGSC